MLGGGSLVIAYPALSAIKQQPQIQRMRLLTTPAVKPFAEILGIFDEIIVIRDQSAVSLIWDSLKAIVGLFRCDALVDLEIHSRLTTVISLLTAARNRIGFYTAISFWRQQLSTHLLFCNLSTGISYFYDQIAGLFGAEISPESISQFRRRIGKAIAQDAGTRKIGLAPCCSGLSTERMLQPNECAEVILCRVGAGQRSEKVEVHLLGAPSDRAYLDAVVPHIQLAVPTAAVFNHAGKTSLRQSVDMISSMDELVCVDSGLLHFARLLGIKTVSFWGPTDPATRLRPFAENLDEVHYYRLPCSPCAHLSQSAPCGGDSLCMRLAVRPGLPLEHNPGWLALGPLDRRRAQPAGNRHPCADQAVISELRRDEPACNH
jgi:ADP-heptose:LPS heptosyltransferase